MSALFLSEWLKLRTTRTAVVLALGLFSITAIATVASLVGDQDYLPEFQHDLPSSAGFSVLFAILFGVLVMTGEFRHGTATPTFLVSPLRERVIAAKAIASVAGGATLALASLVLVYVVALVWFALASADVHLFEGDAIRGALPIVAASAIWGALGVGIGAIVRSQVGALVGTLVYFLIAEPLIGVLSDEVAPYLPGAALGALADGSQDLSRWGGAGVSIGWALALCLAGVFVTVRRDVA
ncbi:MAG TPA: hypothetical protein VNI55_10415 [Gaiellaceae bacterium]|nr:hypothetical protein [Gaiellaceae bacterium]